MRVIFGTLTALALAATPALSQARGFDSTLATTVTGPFQIEVVLSEDLAYRADNLPRKLSDRGGARLNAAFSGNGKYGDRALEELVEDMRDELTRDFAKRGIAMSDTAPTLLRVTIEDVKNNRPTFNQLSVEPGLSFESFGIGGAEITAEIVASGGQVLGTMDYDYYSSLNDHPFRPIGIWQDTKRSFSRFSNKATKALAAMGASGGV